MSRPRSGPYPRQRSTNSTLAWDLRGYEGEPLHGDDPTAWPLSVDQAEAAALELDRLAREKARAGGFEHG
jgi:hypothetical protein